MNVRENIYRVISANFSFHKGAITDDTVASDVAGWDSFSHVQLMLSLEEALNIEFDPIKTFDFENVGQLVSFLEQKKAESE
jgi:acyl carrier protein